MSGTTSDREDPRLTHGADSEPSPQADVYLVATEAERAQGFIRPVRRTYVHDTCGVATTMNQDIAETYARDPKFYGATYCVRCRMHLPVSEFRWNDGSRVGS